MSKYGVFESINMASTRGAARIYDAKATVDIENGTVGYLGDLASGETDVYDFVQGTSTGATVVIVDQPAWNYDDSSIVNQRRDSFIIKAGTIFRVREVKLGDDFGITDMCVEATTRDDLNVDMYLTVDANGKFVVSATASDDVNTIFEAKVLTKRMAGNTLTTSGGQVYGYSQEIFRCKVIVCK